MFEVFVQDDESARRLHADLRIGLALVRQLVELHGGEVTAESEGRGRGARFTIRLPEHAGAGSDAEAERPRRPQALNRLRVLVVDDSEDTLEMLRHLLEIDGAS